MSEKKDPREWKHTIVKESDIDFSNFREVPDTNGRFWVDRNGKVISNLWHQLPEGYWLVVSISGSCNSKPFNRVNITPAGGKARLFQLGAVILSAWVGPKPSKKHLASHVNGKTDDDRLDNLVWRTPQALSDSIAERGTTARGSRVRGGYGLVFNEEQVAAIKCLAEKYYVPGNLIAKALNSLQPRIAEILQGKVWGHVVADNPEAT